MKYREGDEVWLKLEILDIAPISTDECLLGDCTTCNSLPACKDAEYIVDKIDYRFVDSEIIPSPIAKIQAEIDLYNEGIESETEFPNEGSDFNIVEYQAKIEFGYEVLKILGSDE